MQRNYCSSVNSSLVNQNVLVKGWIKKNRKLGKLIFLILSDRSGLVQIVLNDTNQYFELAKNLKRESVVAIEGIVRQRKDANNGLVNGDIEIELTKLIVYSVAQTTPLIIEDETDALEDIRMDYRFLDLRRPIMQKNLMLRSLVVNKARQFLIDNGFIDIETPVLGKPTPEGARDYLVPSRVHKNCFYALPQSPQIYKQLLMVSGFDRYFQVAKCFRDEDLRSDRQPEFTQLDMELSFSSELEIQTIVENLLKYVFKESLNIDLEIPFRRMDYHIAVNQYGSDKPHLGFDLRLHDVTEYFSQSNLKLFSNARENSNVIKCIIADKVLTKNDILDLEKFAKDMGAKGLAWVSYDGDNLNGSIANHIEQELIINFLKENNKMLGTILFVIDQLDITNNSLGIVRNKLAEKLNLKIKDQFNFVWIINWPLYEYNKEKNIYVSAHHPFTQPQDQFHNTFDTDKANALAKAYDIVLNGYELGGGSIRITNPEMQNRMFKTLGLKQEEIRNKFGYLLDAFTYGVPPHGGIAIGIDRLISIMLNLDNIKDVIAFPKNANAFDQMLKAPSHVNEDDLKELNIDLIK